MKKQKQKKKKNKKPTKHLSSVAMFLPIGHGPDYALYNVTLFTIAIADSVMEIGTRIIVFVLFNFGARARFFLSVHINNNNILTFKRYPCVTWSRVHAPRVFIVTKQLVMSEGRRVRRRR